MAMTAMVKDELSRVECTKTSERKAEVTALLRFSGGLHIVGGRVVIEAELDTGSVARRLRPAVVSGGINDAEAAWRGAFLAHGSLTEPGRSSSLEVTCPGPEAAMALVGAARRLGIPAKPREVRATANRLANFDDANLRRSARAAVAASARVERALEILADDAPEHLLVAGRLRLEFGQASLEELGQLANPPLTKDAIAGRIRRLLAMADKRAGDQGIPGTEANLTPEMLAP